MCINTLQETHSISKCPILARVRENGAFKQLAYNPHKTLPHAGVATGWFSLYLPQGCRDQALQHLWALKQWGNWQKLKTALFLQLRYSHKHVLFFDYFMNARKIIKYCSSTMVLWYRTIWYTWSLVYIPLLEGIIYVCGNTTVLLIMPVCWRVSRPLRVPPPRVVVALIWKLSMASWDFLPESADARYLSIIC